MSFPLQDNGEHILCHFFGSIHTELVIGDGHPFTYSRSEKQVLQAYSYIHALYESGVPLYTKEAIRDLHEQIKDSDRDIFTVQGLDGRIVKFKNNFGEVLSISEGPL